MPVVSISTTICEPKCGVIVPCNQDEEELTFAELWCSLCKSNINHRREYIGGVVGLTNHLTNVHKGRIGNDIVAFIVANCVVRKISAAEVEDIKSGKQVVQRIYRGVMTGMDAAEAGNTAKASVVDEVMVQDGVDISGNAIEHLESCPVVVSLLCRYFEITCPVKEYRHNANEDGAFFPWLSDIYKHLLARHGSRTTHNLEQRPEKFLRACEVRSLSGQCAKKIMSGEEFIAVVNDDSPIIEAPPPPLSEREERQAKRQRIHNGTD